MVTSQWFSLNITYVEIVAVHCISAPVCVDLSACLPLPVYAFHAEVQNTASMYMFHVSAKVSNKIVLSWIHSIFS